MLTAVSIPGIIPDLGTLGDTEVYLQFAVASRAMGLRPADARVRPLADSPGLPTVFVTDAGAAGASAESPLLFESESERAELASAIFDAGGERSAIVWGDAGAPASSAEGAPPVDEPIGDFCAGDVSVTIRPGPPTRHLYGPKEYMAEMERRLEWAGPGQHERRFFYGVDRATHPRLLGAKLARSPMRHIVQTSFEHRAARFRKRRDATPPESVDYADSAVREFLDMVFDIFEPLLADLAPGEIDDAMDHFANGALRMRLPNGEWTTQPSSGYFFLFGEVGLLGVELRGPEAWLPVARAAIRAQEIFVRVYEDPRGPKGRYDRYSPCAFNEARRVDRAAQASLRASYGAMDHGALQRRAAENALRWLPGVV